MVAGFPCDDSGKHGRNITFLYDFALEVTLITSPVSYRLHRSAPLHVGGDHIGVSTRRQRVLRAMILEAGSQDTDLKPSLDHMKLLILT